MDCGARSARDERLHISQGRTDGFKHSAARGFPHVRILSSKRWHRHVESRAATFIGLSRRGTPHFGVTSDAAGRVVFIDQGSVGNESHRMEADE
jgi:hypothetical protein